MYASRALPASVPRFVDFRYLYEGVFVLGYYLTRSTTLMKVIILSREASSSHAVMSGFGFEFVTAWVQLSTGPKAKRGDAAGGPGLPKSG